ncbi:MAG: peptidoglycan DD-metalloendopeptidase family protein [Firmicutes bacterium]|nr:peptidoglycan DD-metalloendopeptidase family protein [Bacillota bacterium]
MFEDWHHDKWAKLQTQLSKVKKDCKNNLHKIKNFLTDQGQKIRQTITDFIAGLPLEKTRLKQVFLTALLLLVIASGYTVYAYYDSFTYVVYLDNQEVGYVTTETIIPEFVASLQTQESEKHGVEMVSKQEVAVVKEQRKGIKEDDEAVKQLLKEQLDFGVYAYMITINDKPALAVASSEDYTQILEKLKSAYVCEENNTTVKSVVFNDKLEARWELVDPQDIYSVDKAVEILCYGSDKRQTYLVSRGDSLWTIARKNKISIDEIREANPQLQNSDKLMPGDELNLIVSEPLVNVLVTQEKVVTQSIPYETRYKDDSSLYKGTSKVLQQGKNGTKEIRYRITEKNGKEIEREVLEEKVLEQPTEKVVARGTKKVPVPSGVSGNGRFRWPLAVKGTITSRYGYRWGSFHRGIDIGVPPGTPVLAADSGTVTYAGWKGAYGILVIINHGNGYETKYAHNSAVLVTVGQHVQRGQQIARSGSTGNSTGPHLHFEVFRNGSSVNPLSYL